MKIQTQLLALAAAALLSHNALAQSAGTWMGRVGVTTLTPEVSGGVLSAPGLANSKTDVREASQLSGGITYMYTDNISVDLPLALPFTHKLTGAGAGATYAYFFNAKGSAALTALTNPGGSPTKVTVDSQFIVTPQIGFSYAMNGKLMLDVAYTKSLLKTTTHLSTGQTADINLDPSSLSLSLGFKF